VYSCYSLALTPSCLLGSFAIYCFQCGLKDAPGVYARVSSGYTWLQSQICCNAANPPTDCGTVDSRICPNQLSGGGGGGGGFDDDTPGNTLPSTDDWLTDDFTDGKCNGY